MLTVFVREIIEPVPNQNTNIIELEGYICKEPIYRTTPFKREICDILLAVNRAYNKSDYLPCIAWGRNARFVSNLAVGEKTTITVTVTLKKDVLVKEQIGTTVVTVKANPVQPKS